MNIPNDTPRRGVLHATRWSNRLSRLTLLMLVMLLLVAIYAVAKQRIDLPVFTTYSLILRSCSVLVVAIASNQPDPCRSKDSSEDPGSAARERSSIPHLV
jgi:hypothetical protein